MCHEVQQEPLLALSEESNAVLIPTSKMQFVFLTLYAARIEYLQCVTLICSDFDLSCLQVCYQSKPSFVVILYHSYDVSKRELSETRAGKKVVHECKATII
jgi:hypothetical protein